jgi:hypothetical protein
LAAAGFGAGAPKRPPCLSSQEYRRRISPLLQSWRTHTFLLVRRSPWLRIRDRASPVSYKMKPKRARVPYTVTSPIGYLPLGIRWLHGANLRKASLKQTFKYWRLSTCASTLFCRACDAPTNGQIVSLQFCPTLCSEPCTRDNRRLAISDLRKRHSSLRRRSPEVHSVQTSRSSSRRASVLRPRALILGLVCS